MRRFLIALAAVGVMAAAVATADDMKKSSATPQAGSNPAAAAAATPAATTPAGAPESERRMYTPADLKWVEAPAALPKGAKMAVLHGDPAAPGIFAMRIALPAGYKVPPHFHPANEHVTVLSGDFYMGLGDTWDETKGHAMPAASFHLMPAGVRHFAWSKTEAVIQVHAMGPWGITYVNPQDDPRNQKQAAK